MGYTVIGLSIAAVYAVSAAGLVLTYSAAGVFNLGHGALGALAAFAYWQMRVAWGWNELLSIAIILLLLGPMAGIVLERLLRQLDGTTDSTKLVVSVALLLCFIGLAQLVWSGNVGRTVPAFFPGRKVDIGPTSVTMHQLVTMLAAVIVAALLRWLLRCTRMGAAMRATVDDRRLVTLYGIRAVRTKRLAWVLGATLAALSGVLVASTAGLNAVVLSMLIVNAYAAAVFGRLRSLPMAFVGALVVGLTVAYLQGYLPQSPYLAGLRLAAPVLVLFGALLVFPQRRLRPYAPSREHFPAPGLAGTAALGVAVIAVAVVLATTLSPGDMAIYGRLFPFAVIGLSLVPLVGWANQASLCQLGFAGIGAIAMAQFGAGGNPLGLVAAAIVPALVGILVALPVARLSGIYLALATAAFAVALDRWIFSLPTFQIHGVEIAILDTGSRSVSPISLLGWNLGSDGSRMMVSAAVLAILLVAVAAMRNSPFGRRIVALRDGDAACATFGVSPARTRIAVFACSAGIAGIGGALLGIQNGAARVQDFEFTAGLPLFLGVVAAGAGFVAAPCVSSLITNGLLPLAIAVVPGFSRWAVLLIGITAIALGRQPSGLLSIFHRRAAGAPRKHRVAVSWAIGTGGLLFTLRAGGALSNWAFVWALVGSGACSAGLLVFAQARANGHWRGPDDHTVEWMGIDGPWSPSLVGQLDAELALTDAAPAR